MPINYFEILRSYNEFKIAKQVGAKANSLFYAILNKFNTLRYPKTLTIYNSELLDLSGLTKDELNPARNKLLQVQINGQYIIKYHSKGTRKPGVYEINLYGFETYFNELNNDWTEKTANSTTNPNTNHDTNSNTNNQRNAERLIVKSDTLLTKHNITKQNETKNNNNNPVNVYRFYENEGFGTISGFSKDLLDDFVDNYSEAWLIEAMKKAVALGKRNLRYVEGILKNWRANGIDIDPAKDRGDLGEKSSDGNGGYNFGF